ncbi:MAG: guanylate kinase [Coprococcus sp.]|nr:guanylate kinase [Coprococcus sp.]
MMKKGSLIVISGFSGVGKGTVVKRLVSDYGYDLSISATTRAPREGEVHGREYFFMDRGEFENLIDYGGFIEWTQYVENYYGTPKKYVEESLNQGRDIILEIEVMGAMHIKEQYPDALLIFIAAPSIRSLKDRLAGRGTENEATIIKRLKKATEEAADMDKYDYIVINDDLDMCVSKVNSVIESYACRCNNNLQFIQNIKDELKRI